VFVPLAETKAQLLTAVLKYPGVFVQLKIQETVYAVCFAASCPGKPKPEGARAAKKEQGVTETSKHNLVPCPVACSSPPALQDEPNACQYEASSASRSQRGCMGRVPVEQYISLSSIKV
jgi:hypothetical protein